MSALLSIAWREVKDRWTWVAASVALAFFPPILGLIVSRLQEDWGFFALVVFTAAIVVAALVLGASVLGRDLAQERLGFFYTRPIPWWSIWGGKLLAALLLVLSTVLIMVPPLVQQKGLASISKALTDWEGASYLLSLVLVGLGLSHFAKVAYHARSRWVLVDLVLLVVVARLGWHVSWVVWNAYSAWTLWHLLPAVAALAFLAASAAQVAAGRVSLTRSHRVMSITLWGLLLVSLGGVWGHARWRLAHLTPAVLGSVTPEGALDDSPWVSVGGYRPESPLGTSFLVDTASGRSVHASTWTWNLAIARDRPAAAWLEVVGWPDWSGGRWPASVMYVDLTRPDPRVVELAVPVPDTWASLALSPNGERLAVVEDDGIRFHDVRSGDLVSRTPFDPPARAQVAFVGENRLRAYLVRGTEKEPVPTEILEITLPGGEAIATGQLDAAGWRWLQLDASGERVLTFGTLPARGAVITLHDARSGRRLAAWLDGRVPGLRRPAAFLSDGRVAVVDVEESKGRLRLVTRDGELEQTWALGPARVVRLGSEARPGQIFVSVETTLGSPTTLLVDLADGRILRREEGLAPLALPGPPASPTVTLFAGPQGSLVRLDLETGQRETVAPPWR